MKTLDEAMDEVITESTKTRNPEPSAKLMDTHERHVEILIEAGENEKVQALVACHLALAVNQGPHGVLFSIFCNGLIVGMAMEKADDLPVRANAAPPQAADTSREEPQRKERYPTWPSPAIPEHMRKAENPLLPYFGRDPQDFGIPLDYKPEGPNQSVAKTRGYEGEQPLSSDQVVDKLGAIENLYVVWRNAPVRWFRRLVLKLARRPLRLFREQLYLVCRAYAQAASDSQASEMQATAQAQNTKTVGDFRELRAFLYQHFVVDLERADVGNIPLLQLCKEIMFRQKQEISR
jgi:hypothetical protein